MLAVFLFYFAHVLFSYLGRLGARSFFPILVHLRSQAGYDLNIFENTCQ